ncbi:MAG: DNA polymerase III subunit delta [Candidatus Cloacimonetes bacterium]|nr:DNA polymerase III subunit delta [Candidatus Cloacimonadota bacterium]
MSRTVYANQILRAGGKLPPANCYLFWGEDGLSQRRLEAMVRQEALAKGSEDFDLTVFYGAETKAEQIIEQLAMLPMLSPKRVVVVRGADEMRADEGKRLLPYIENPSPSVVLVLTAGKIDQRRVLWKGVMKHAESVRCTPPWEPRDIERWLQGEIRNSGYSVDRDALSLFAGSVELNYETAWQEWEKLKLYVGERRRITTDDVTASLGQLRTFSVYELQDALGSRNLKRGMEMLENILSAGESPVFVVAVLTRFYHVVWRIHALRGHNLNEQEVRQRALRGIMPRFQDRYMTAARNIGPDSIRRVFEALYDTDAALKSTGDRLDRFLAEIMVWRLCREV